nr:type II toxin-antitoxin system RelE/ParE family toxin [Photorhabdus cinerea]
MTIIDYISDDNLHAAQQLKNAIENKVATLPERPHGGYPTGTTHLTTMATIKRDKSNEKQT